MWYNETRVEILKKLGTSKDGLSEGEAEKRLEKYGRNELAKAKKKGLLRRFFEAMCDRMTVILLIAAAISFVSSLISGENSADPFIILIIVVANAFISALQERKADRALEALKKMSSPESIVRRGGKNIKIRSSGIVPGDIVILEKGCVVPCDGMILESNELLCNESSLTGESFGVYKNEKEGNAKSVYEASNCVFSSSSVISGRAVIAAVKTGMESSVGKIASYLSKEPEKTPLQKRLSKLGTILGNVTVGICLFIFVFSLFKGMPAGEMFLTGVSLAVAAIPEGLPAIVTVVMSVGVQTMARKNAIIKRLPAVETLGCADVICSDKTGTLTQNKMQVSYVYGNAEKLNEAFALCNDDLSPTESALLSYCKNAEEIQKKYRRLAEVPFDSSKKYMITLNEYKNGYIAYMKGAPEIISAFCGGSFLKYKEKVEKAAKKGLRVMGFASCFLKDIPKDLTKINYEFFGICGICDPPREEVFEAVKICKKAGIRPVMITGDHIDTAVAVASQIGICGHDEEALTESVIKNISDRELCEKVKKTSVFARVSPESKLRIVEAFRKNGRIVAMTGDGVNDAPALKHADIGCAMGKSGTEVAKEASDMILTDDNFATVVSAVKEGRGVYENIRRSVHFLLSCNLGELFTVFFSILISLPSPLSAILLLWVNLTTDSLPAIALGLEKTPDSAMERPPVDPKTPLFSAKRVLRMIFEGILIGTLSISAFVIGIKRQGFMMGRTMCFFVLAVSQLFHSFNMRSEKSIFSRKKEKNPFVIIAFLICFALTSFVILIPGARTLFGTLAMGAEEWIICLCLSAVPVVFCEVYKILTFRG